MNALVLGFALTACTSADPEPPKPISPERIQELVKKLEVPTRATSDQRDGPPEYPWPSFNYRWRSDDILELKRAGDAAVPALLVLLEDKTKPGQARAHAAAVLIDRVIGTKVKPDPKIIAALNAALKENEPALRAGTLSWLSTRGLASNCTTWETIKKNAEREKLSGRPPVEWGAVDYLRRVPPPEERSFTPEVMDTFLLRIVPALADEHPEVVAAAANTIYCFGRPKYGVSELLTALKHKEPSVRAQAAVALGRVGGNNPDVPKALIAALKQKELEVRVSAAWALGRVGKGDAASLKSLTECLDPKDPAFAAAIWALGEFGPEAKSVVPQLVEAVKYTGKIVSPDTDLGSLRDVAVRALGNIGPDAKAAVPVLLECLDKKYYAGDPKTEYYLGNREEVLNAIDKIDPAVAKKAREEEKRKAEEYKRWHEELSRPLPPVIPPERNP